MRLNQVTVSARDLPASIAFYRTLGLNLIVRSDRYARFKRPDGGSTCSLHLDPAARGVSETTVYFENDDPNGVVARLNRPCLYKAGEIRRFPPWRLTDAGTSG